MDEEIVSANPLSDITAKAIGKSLEKRPAKWNEGNVFALQRIMGHSNLDMTKRYLALTSQDIQGEHAKSSPLTKIAGRKARAVRLGTGKGESEED